MHIFFRHVFSFKKNVNKVGLPTFTEASTLHHRGQILKNEIGGEGGRGGGSERQISQNSKKITSSKL
jgi:hypothetical protein